MNFTLALADIAVGPAVRVFGLTDALIALVLIILGEAVVLWVMQWGSIGLSLFESLLMNIISAGVGMVAAAVIGDFTVPWLVVMLVLSVLIEKMVLAYRHREWSRKAWLVTVVANLISYGAIAIVFPVNPV